MARYVRVASISFDGAPPGPDHKERALRTALDLIERAADDRPDLIVLPETFTGLGLGDQMDQWVQTAEPVPGPTTEAVGRAARRHGAYIVCPLVQKERAGLYNAAVLLDRRGRVVGLFQKMFPTIGELEAGIRPGRAPVVLETDFGRVGFAICFDLNFREVGQGTRDQGAEVLVFCSMYDGGNQLWNWAFDFGFHIVTAVSCQTSRILNPVGRVLVESSMHSPIIAATLNLDCRQCHLDFNMDRMKAAKHRYKDRIAYDVVSPEGRFLLTSRHPTKSVDDLIAEFGFEPIETYLARARRARQKAMSRARKG